MEQKKAIWQIIWEKRKKGNSNNTDRIIEKRKNKIKLKLFVLVFCHLLVFRADMSILLSLSLSTTFLSIVLGSEIENFLVAAISGGISLFFSVVADSFCFS